MNLVFFSIDFFPIRDLECFVEVERSKKENAIGFIF